MQFSEFVLVERVGVFVDPLGFMRPAGDWQDTLFRQFTVLSNHPGYHGVLCAVWEVLEAQGLASGSDAFARRFREAEILWGWLNALQDTSVLNVRKYARLWEDDVAEYSLKDLSPRHPVFSRLSYGTLGHYTQPSIDWGFLAKSPKGVTLTDQGRALAAAMNRRGDQGWKAPLTDWLAGKPLSASHAEELQTYFHLDATPGRGEKEVWRSAIDGWKKRYPHTVRLWAEPVPIEVQQSWQSSAPSWARHYDDLGTRYLEVKDRIEAIRDFERLTGAVRFVFDMKLAAIEHSADSRISEAKVHPQLGNAIVGLAKVCVEQAAPVDSGVRGFGLWAQLAQATPALADVEEIILRHHVTHQRTKGVSPFVEGNRMLVPGKVDGTALGKLLERLDDEPELDRHLDEFQFRTRRDWHFERCRIYSDWSHA